MSLLFNIMFYSNFKTKMSIFKRTFNNNFTISKIHFPLTLRMTFTLLKYKQKEESKLQCSRKKTNNNNKKR